MKNDDQFVLGIDISKKHFDVALLLPSGKRKNKKFPNTKGGFKSLLSWIDSFDVSHLHACMEATNNYGHPLAEFLYDSGFNVSMVNPVQVKGFAQSEMLRTKTDKQDASLIARFCKLMKPAYWEPEPKNVRELKALVRRVDALIEMKQQEVNRLAVADPIVAEDIQRHVELIASRIEELRSIIRKKIDNDPDLREQRDLLLTISGIGEKTVATLLAYFASVARFKSAKHLASYCGVAPTEYSSGTSVRRRGKMSKMGQAQLRKALFMPAMVALKYNPVLMELNRRLTAAGKPKMLIIGAAMRKLTHIIYGVLKNKTPFSAEKYGCGA